MRNYLVNKITNESDDNGDQNHLRSGNRKVNNVRVEGINLETCQIFWSKLKIFKI